MSIHTLKTSIFKSPAKILVNPVNTVGVMGKGLALQFKTRYPAMFEHYKQICEFDDFKPGQLFIWSNGKEVIVNFPTKQHWKQKSSLGIVAAGLAKLALATKDPASGLGSVARPWRFRSLVVGKVDLSGG